MSIPTTMTQDSDLERWYTQARSFDLLTREQEQEIDARKWAAIEQLRPGPGPCKFRL